MALQINVDVVLRLNHYSMTLPAVSVGVSNILGLDALISFGMKVNLADVTMCFGPSHLGMPAHAANFVKILKHMHIM